MSQLTPAGIDRLNQESNKIAETDEERELGQFRPGDKNLTLFNTSGLSRISQSRQAPKRQPAKATLITKSPHRKRVSGLGSTAGNTGNSGTVNKKELGGE
tara:strand:+ start:625 stop:924 length:300 start_codon:yes stop_codon:yes gene_type:complete